MWIRTQPRPVDSGIPLEGKALAAKFPVTAPRSQTSPAAL